MENNNNPEVAVESAATNAAEAPVEKTGKGPNDFLQRWRIIIFCIFICALFLGWCGGNFTATFAHNEGGLRLMTDKEVSIVQESASKKGAQEAMDSFMKKGFFARTWEAMKGK